MFTGHRQGNFLPAVGRDVERQITDGGLTLGAIEFDIPILQGFFMPPVR
jgi:hypothetical protein